MDLELKGVLMHSFPAEEADKVIAFLERDFSFRGQVVIGSVFLFAKDYGKSVEEVLKLCEEEWERNWNYQHPDIRGSVDAPESIGLQNVASMERIYEKIGIPSPRAAKKDVKILTGALVVRTRNSTYRFGKANEKGERTVSRYEKPLEFTRCKINVLAVGQDMELECLDGSHPGWYTTNVYSIEEA